MDSTTTGYSATGNNGCAMQALYFRDPENGINRVGKPHPPMQWGRSLIFDAINPWHLKVPRQQYHQNHHRIHYNKWDADGMTPVL
jgi:hypothetical protein